MEYIYVKSPNKEPVLLTDSTTRDPKNKKEYFAMSITRKMAEEGEPVKVPSNPFFHGHITLGNIVLVNKKEKPGIEKVNGREGTRRGESTNADNQEGGG